jgi:hypothetical protein
MEKKIAKRLEISRRKEICSKRRGLNTHKAREHTVYDRRLYLEDMQGTLNSPRLT